MAKNKKVASNKVIPLALILLIFCIIAGLAYRFSIDSKQETLQLSPSPSTAIVSEPVSKVSPPSTAQPTQRPTSKKVAKLEDVDYVLPPAWKAEIRDGLLFITPEEGGGYLAVKINEYPGDIGRREFYCQQTKFCIKETYFESMKLGNIDGYSANALDNSGGGTEYFGAKENSFYIISSYAPPGDTEFSKNYSTVLNSFKF